MFSSISFTALAIALSLTFENVVLASALRLRGHDSDIKDSYIIKLKASANATNHINSLPFPFSVEDANSPITHWWPDFFKGYSGIFVGADLDAILASPDVEYVEKTGIVRCAAILFTSHTLNHTHRLEALVHKRGHHGTSKRSAPESLSEARTWKQ